MEIQAREDDADVGVEQRAVSYAFVVLGRDVAPVSGVGAADEVDAALAQLRLDAGLADDEDFVARGGRFMMVEM